MLTGNMISDFVKGKKRFDYAEGIQQGIRLHRSIDEFTDRHPIIAEAKEYFRPVYRLYSGALVDVVFDHFLAIEPTVFSDQELFSFSQWVYQQLEEQHEAWPEKFSFMFPYMKEQNWLYGYRTTAGAEKSLGGVVRRARYIEEAGPAIEIFHLNYQPLQELFRLFWPELNSHAFDKWQEGRNKKI